MFLRHFIGNVKYLAWPDPSIAKYNSITFVHNVHNDKKNICFQSIRYARCVWGNNGTFVKKLGVKSWLVINYRQTEWESGWWTSTIIPAPVASLQNGIQWKVFSTSFTRSRHKWQYSFVPNICETPTPWKINVGRVWESTVKPTPINHSDMTDTAGADMGSTQGARRETGVEPMPGDRKKLNRVPRVPPDPEVAKKTTS
jgi:hypothetical protein